jgi:hypothetical protein
MSRQLARNVLEDFYDGVDMEDDASQGVCTLRVLLDPLSRDFALKGFSRVKAGIFAQAFHL